MRQERSAWRPSTCFALVSLLVLPSCGLIEVVKKPQQRPLVEPVLSEPTNLSFENVDARGRPVGWKPVDNVGSFGVDEEVKTSGRRSAWVVGSTLTLTSGVALYQCIKAHSYRGKKFKVEADLRTDQMTGEAALGQPPNLAYLMIHPQKVPGQQSHSWDRLSSSSSEWERVGDWEWGETVSSDASWICFGFGPSRGVGKMWADNLTVKVG